MFIEKLIDKIKKDAIETGDSVNWKTILSERIKSLLSPPEFNEEITSHILEKVDEGVTSYFNKLDALSLTQRQYEKLKQSCHDCVHSGNNVFIFSTTDEYAEQSIQSAKNLIKYLEVSNKVEFYEPKETDKFILSVEDGKGELRNKQGIKLLPSRGLLNLYQQGDELIPNVDFFIRPCPVCSRYIEAEAVLLYCPECNKLQFIAYPFIEFERMMGPEHDDDYRGQSNQRYGNDSWSDDDIDDIFEGDPGNTWNVD